MANTVSPSPFDYRLPEELIAQQPAASREQARLLVVRRHDGGTISHHSVSELPSLLDSGDLLVANDSAVIPARLRARRETGGRVELLVIANGSELTECLFRSSKGLRAGETLLLPGRKRVRVASAAEGRCRLELDGAAASRLMTEHGEVPLPPYIDRPPTDHDRVRYQTVYARIPGAVAAPTAGLHFSRGLIERLESAGMAFATLTLAVGPGTFMPVRPGKQEMEAEHCRVSRVLARRVNDTRARGRRVVAVGTTSVRALESACDGHEGVRAFEGDTDLFIRPGHRFRAIDALVTNFHLPGTTLLGLVAAFAGPELTRRAYLEAVEQRYRFYSYGDAMLVL